MDEKDTAAVVVAAAAAAVAAAAAASAAKDEQRWQTLPLPKYVLWFSMGSCSRHIITFVCLFVCLFVVFFLGGGGRVWSDYVMYVRVCA